LHDAAETTASVALAVLSLDLAEIVASPPATPLATPEALTVATPVFDEVHDTDGVATMLPSASYAVAVNVCVDPEATDAVDGVTSRRFMGVGTTVTSARPDFPLLVAVITAFPTATAVARPDVETAATARLELDQLTALPLMTSPAALCSVASSCAVLEMGIDTDSGATATEATVFGEPDEASVTPLPQLRAADVTNTTKPTALARLGMRDTHIAASFRELAGRVEMPLPTTAGPLATLEVEYDSCEADGPFECGERYESGRRKRRETLRPNQPLFD